ncbi:hypothetical protein AAFF_G00356330 [Aldrovandia affinis]|uniref:Uncharacterized protein n=1 Tax=Aldrovandia affinis TaxID=143900 RepID=A0AAD7T8L2_9TELE|nr:hypothetical protein AAFF_G00356330 [Aldrovandia affinis]
MRAYLTPTVVTNEGSGWPPGREKAHHAAIATYHTPHATGSDSGATGPFPGAAGERGIMGYGLVVCHLPPALSCSWLFHGNNICLLALRCRHTVHFAPPVRSPIRDNSSLRQKRSPRAGVSKG